MVKIIGQVEELKNYFHNLYPIAYPNDSISSLDFEIGFSLLQYV